MQVLRGLSVWVKEAKVEAASIRSHIEDIQRRLREQKGAQGPA